jgi:hypothetical protein
MGKDFPVCKHAENKYEDENGDFNGSKEVVEVDATLAPDAVDETGCGCGADCDATDNSLTVRMVELAGSFDNCRGKCDGIHGHMAEEDEGNTKYASGEEGGASKDVFKLGMLVLAVVKWEVGN